MNVEYANIFIRSAEDVFQQVVHLTLSRKSLVLKDSPIPTRPIAIIIGITGFARGQIVYAMDESFALSITRAMMPNKLPLDAKKLMNSAVSEIANIITGRASISLAGENAKIYLTPPVVMMGSDISIDFLNIPTIALTLISEIGLLEINIAMVNQSEEADHVSRNDR